jgi:hypothetical protein
VVVVVLAGPMVPREGHHNLLDTLKIDVLARCVKSVRGQDTQLWIVGIITMRATHPPNPKLLQLLHTGMVLIQIGILTLLQQIPLLQTWTSSLSRTNTKDQIRSSQQMGQVWIFAILVML